MFVYFLIQIIIVLMFMIYFIGRQEKISKVSTEKLSNLVIHVASILSTGAEAEKRKLKATEDLTDIMKEISKQLHANKSRTEN